MRQDNHLTGGHAVNETTGLKGAAMFKTIVADPPWMPSLGATWQSSYNDKARPHRQYPTMGLDDIKRLNVPSAKQAHLYLWSIAQHIDWAYEVCYAWGFEPVIMLTWKKPGLGVGRFQCNTEHVLVGRKGSRHGNPFGQGGRCAAATGGTLFEWPRGIHSEKPSEFYALVEKLSPGPYLEMFARKQRCGWDVWGNEVETRIEI